MPVNRVIRHPSFVRRSEMFARVTHRLAHDASVTRMRGAAPKWIRHNSNEGAARLKEYMDSEPRVDMYGIHLKARAELPCDACRMVPALYAADTVILELWDKSLLSGPKVIFQNRHHGYACLHSMSVGVNDDTPLQTGFLEFELRTKHKEDLAPMLNVYVEEMCKVGGDSHVILQSLDFEQYYTGERRDETEVKDVMRALKGGIDDCTKRLVWPAKDGKEASVKDAIISDKQAIIDLLTVKRLKEILREQNLKVSGPKQELRDRLRAHMQDKRNSDNID